MPYAAISLEQNNIAKADGQLQLARQYVYRSGQYKRLQTLYPLLSKLYAAKGNAALASMFLDSFILVKDSLTRKFNALQVLRAQQKVDMEQQKAEMENIISQKKIEILKRNILIAVVVLMMLLSVYIYRQQQKKQLLFDTQPFITKRSGYPRQDFCRIAGFSTSALLFFDMI